MIAVSILPAVTQMGAIVSGVILAIFLECERRVKVPIFESSLQRAIYLTMSVFVFALWILTGLFGIDLPRLAVTLLVVTGSFGIAVQSGQLEILLSKVAEP
jgi:hypothetical protein